MVDTHFPLQPVDLLILESCCQWSTHTARYSQSTYSSWKAAVSGRHTLPATASRPAHSGKLLSVVDTHCPLQPVDLLILESCCQWSTHTARYSQSTYSSWKAAVSGRRTPPATASRPTHPGKLLSVVDAHRPLQPVDLLTLESCCQWSTHTARYSQSTYSSWKAAASGRRTPPATASRPTHPGKLLSVVDAHRPLQPVDLLILKSCCQCSTHTARYSQSTYSSWKAAVSGRHTPPATASRPTHIGKLLSVVDAHRPIQPVDLLILESCCQCSTHTARYNQSTYSSWKAAVSARHTPPATASRPTHPGKLLSVLDTHRPLQPVDLLILESCCQWSTHTSRYSQSTYSSWKAAVSGRRTPPDTASRPTHPRKLLSVVDTHRPIQPVDLLILESCCQCSTHTARYSQSTYSSWKAAVSGRHTPPDTASRPTHPGKLLSVVDAHRPLQPVDLLILESCCQWSTHSSDNPQPPPHAKRFTNRASPTNHWN